MTAADHANTVRDLLLTVPGKRTVPQEQAAYAALDALVAQAETAEAQDRRIARLTKDLQDLQRANDHLRWQIKQMRRATTANKQT